MSLEKYKRLTDVQHVLQRSGVYLGSIINTEREAFVVENDKIVLKTVGYNPAIIRCLTKSFQTLPMKVLEVVM